MKIFKKVLCTLLVVLTLITSIPMVNLAGVDFGITAEAATITSYSQGDIIEFGWYPQSKVTDSTTISALNSAGGEWISYNYYSGTGSYSDGKMTASDYMRYKDVIYGSDKYRGVVFDSYRPHHTGYTSSSSYTYQDENGFFTNTVYWFKYEPIMWRVLDPVTGMVMSESILDSQPYNNYVLSSGTDKYGYTAYWGDSSKTYYANNYAESSLRQWLNNDFYNTAFSKAQQDIIKSTTLDNSAYSESYSEYDSASTKDKIFLLSYNEVRNSNFGFNSSSSASDTARRAQGSDYAQSQGLYVYRSSGSTYNGNSYWLLRSPGYHSYSCCSVNYGGNSGSNCNVGNTHFGVRPALCFNRISDIGQSDIDESWKEDKVKIEFRFADTKEIIDTSDQYLMDQQVAFNFTTTEDVHRMKMATNGVLYLEEYYFPLKYFKADWQSAFGDRTEYICQSYKTINAKAGDTIVVYLSVYDNQGSVTTKVSGGKTENYGAHNVASTIEGEIRDKSKELAEYIDDYIALINGKDNKSNKKKKTDVSEENLHKAAKAIMNADEKIYTIPIKKAKFEYALCYALATVLKDETFEAINLGKIDYDKSEEEIALNLTNTLIKNFSEIDNQIVEYDGYKVHINNFIIKGKAFNGTYTIYNKNGLVYGPGPRNSPKSATSDTLYDYYIAMSDLINDALKNAMASILTELSDVTGLTSLTEEALNSSVKNALSILEEKGFGRVKDILMTAREIYIKIKDIASATSELSVSNLLNTEQKTRELYEIVFENKFTSSKATEAAAKAIISKIEEARKTLYNLLYYKLYGVTKDDAGLLKQIGNWINTKILCPVDVEIYNSEGELIGYVDTQGRHEEYIYFTEDIYIEVQGDEKFIYYPADKTVTLKFYGTEDGEMTYSIESLADGESIDRVNYYSVPLFQGSEYSQTIEANTSFSDCIDTLVLIGDTTISADEYLTVDNDTAHIRILYSSTDGGSVSGNVYYPKGDCATLYAYPEEGYVFKGWYENEECVSIEEIYRFAAIRDIVLEAKFEEIEESTSEDEESTVLDRIILSENELFLKNGECENLYYIAIPSTSNINLKWYSSDESIATVDENGIVSALSEGATVISVEDTFTKINVQCRVIVDSDSSCYFLGHKFKEWHYQSLPTCETAGTEKRECMYCDYFETTKIPSEGHSYEVFIVPATCTSNGYTSNICRDCDNSYTSDITEKLAHNMNIWYTVKPATCETNGTEQRDCSECDYSETQEIPATGHDFDGSGCKYCDYDKSDDCGCNCHKGGIAGFFFKLILFFQKIFKTNKTCSCGVNHY